MFTRILLAIDDTTPSQAAVEATARLATGVRSPAEVHVLHVLEHGPGRSATYDLESAEEANAVVGAATADLDRAGVPAKGEIAGCPAGAVGQTIAEAAARHGCEIVVVGSRRLSNLGAAMLGSVAHDVVRHFGGGVLIAR